MLARAMADNLAMARAGLDGARLAVGVLMLSDIFVMEFPCAGSSGGRVHRVYFGDMIQIQSRATAPNPGEGHVFPS